MSTPATVRSTLVTALQGIAAGLGYAAANGNIKAYAPEFHQLEQIGGYFSTTVTGQSGKAMRAHCVIVNPTDDYEVSGRIVNRTYDITIRGFYEFGVNGAGYLAATAGQTRILQLLYDMTSNLNGSVTRSGNQQVIPPTVELFTGLPDDKLIVADVVLQAEHRNASLS